MPSLIEDNELTDENIPYDNFSTNYLHLLNQDFPLVIMSRKLITNNPHITSGIKVNITNKNRLTK